MLMNLRHAASITVVVLSFFVFSFAIGAESAAQTKKSAKPAPTPAKKTAKAAPAPSKKAQAKATPTPKKAADKNAKNKTADKKSKSAKDQAKSKTATAKKSDSKKTTTADKAKSKTADKKTTASKTKTASKPETKSKSSPAKTAAKKDAPKAAIVKTAASSETSTRARTETAAPQVVVADISARVRSQAKSTAPELGYIKLGTILDVAEKTPSWYRVRFINGAKTSTGWIAAKSVNDLKSGGKNQIYRQLAERHYKPGAMDFATAAEVYEFLGYAAETETSDAEDAALELKKLLALRSAVKAIPAGKANDAPYRQFVKANEKNLVYSEPAASWMVGSNLFWDLHKKYSRVPLADQIAWEGAQNPLPGECEGYVNCHLFYIRMTSAEYLSRHPGGKHNLQALTDLTNYLQPIAASSNKTSYNGPTDVTDRAEFNNLLAELRTIVSRVPLTEKEKPLQFLRKIAEDFR